MIGVVRERLAPNLARDAFVAVWDVVKPSFRTVFGPIVVTRSA